MTDQALELERCRKELTDFAYRVSHDLQGPLRNIVGFTSLLGKSLNDRLSAEELDEFNIIRNAAAQAQSMVEALLQFSRLSAVTLSMHEINTNALATVVLTKLRDRIANTGAQIELGNLPIVQGDEKLLSWLFEILIDNALIFTGKGKAPVIRINAERGEREWLISVRDQGIGIAAKNHARIFELFQRLHAPGETPGIGAGLAFAKKIVERHGGTIAVSSDAGQGALFTFLLPDR